MKFRKKCCRLSVLFLLSLITFSCAKDIVDLQGSIVGTVTNSRTHEPLAGVSMTLSPSGKTVSTGSDGKFEFTSLDVGNYTVQAVKNDYKTDSKSVAIVAGETSKLDFQLTPSLASLKVSQTTLDFGNTSTTLTLDLVNDGNAVLKWQISEDASWLSCLPSSGEIQAGESASVVVNVDRKGLERGNYSQTLAIASNGGSEVVRVNMGVQGVSLKISPESLDFGSTMSSMRMTLTNTGTGNISYNLSPSKEWVKLDKTSGSFSTSEIVTVSVNRSGFGEGDYEAEISVRVNDETMNVAVRMNIPSKAKPTVALHSVDGVTFNTALFKGAVVSVGSSKVTSRGFCWSVDEEPVLETGEKCNLGDCDVAEDYSYTASSLEPSTEYYVRAYAVNTEGVSYSNQIKFKTRGTPQLAEVETGAVSDVQASQAMASGNILSLGNVDEVSGYGHVWGLKPNPTLADSKTSLGKTHSSGSFNSTLTGLSPNKTYHVRAYATNSVGTAYGADVEFKTSFGDVVVATSDVTGITYNSAVAGGEVTSLGGHSVAECGVCWATAPSPTINSDVVKSPSPSDSFKVTLTGLSASTVYHVRAYVKTETGTISYGKDVEFTTSAKDVQIGIGDFGEDKNWTRK